MFQKLDDSNYQSTFSSTEEGICIFYKKLCPHCANMEKVLTKVQAKMPQITMFSIDSEESPEAMAANDAQRAPTLVFIKGGKVVATKSGLMNPKETIAFYQES